jgi:membrane protease YdiL (CAAX protease family)
MKEPTLPEVPTPSMPEGKRDIIIDIFLQPDGLLRPGWRFLLYVLIGFALFYFFGLLGDLWRQIGIGAIWRGMIAEGSLVVAAFLPALIMARIENRTFADYGLPRRGAFGKFFWIGAIWGFISLTLLLLVLRTSHVFYFGGIALHGVRIVKFAAFYALFFVLVSFFEEFLFRGYTLYTGSTSIGFWPSAVIFSLLFGSVHLMNSGESPVGALAAASIGFFFCLTVRRTGDLWFAIGFHTSWNWAQSYLYSVPNSGTRMTGHLTNATLQGPIWLAGGSVGPEGSALCFVLIAILWIVFNRVYPKAKYPKCQAASL